MERKTGNTSWTLQLNAGEKWLMDDHTRTMFAGMVEKLEQHGLNEGGQGLGEALQTNIEELIRGCTMTGGAHDELHKFLVDYVPAVDALASAGGVEEVHAVSELLDSYPQYFE